nr:PREDICTED: meiosis-specific nuclear structural protein 1-like [Bemisia tabaci]XP_018912588.1 PREDICTED: meiosis-specific nuclear structural protein 1-like [Bemisia tabaci]XP_018912589.1 PREDICTED: meiosis-specific nuclear structural protein 1-like [Bemisia tabaci]
MLPSKDDSVERKIGKLSEDEFRQLKQRQQLQVTSKELQELEQKLRTAYMYKELEAQIEERKLNKLQEKLQEELSHKVTAAIIKSGELMEEEKAREAAKKKEIYRKCLENQIYLNAVRREDAFRQFLREKQIIDDIARALREEELRAQEAKLRLKQLTKESIERFLKARELWKLREKEAQEEEDRRIRKYLAEEQNLEEKRKRAIQEKVEKQAKIQDLAAQKIKETKTDDDERAEIIAELIQEEKRQALEERHRMEIENKMRQRMDFVKSLEKQRQEEEQKRKEEREKDALFAQQMMDKMAEEDKLEQMSNEKRRQKQIAHRRIIQELIEAKKQKREEERKQMAWFEQLQLEKEQERCRLIEEERRRLLQEHAANLIGYLPRGLLREDDFSYLGEEFRRDFLRSTNKENY